MRACVLLLLCATGISGAQTPADSVRWGFGVAAGQLEFTDGSRESALGLTVAARAWNWLDVSVNPTYAWARFAAVQGGSPAQSRARNVSGLTDLPVNVGISHSVPGPWSPTIAFALGITLPTGDSATLGTGKTGFGASLGAGFAPLDNFGFSVAVGRSVSNGYSAGLGSSSTTSLALSARATTGTVGIGLGLSGDVGAVPAGFESARSIAAGMAVPLFGDVSLNLDGSTGLTRGSPTWAYAVGIGTRAAAIAPYQRLRQAFGLGTKINAKPKTKAP
jgi:hypothetical protein